MVERADPGTLTWRVHPFAERPTRGWLAIVILAGVFAALHVSGDDGFIPLAALVLFLSLSPYFLPTTYELNATGVTQRIAFVRFTRRWEEFRRYYHDDVGVKLSPFAHRSRREPFRGVWLRFSGNRDEVLAFVAAKIGESRAPDRPAANE